MKRIKQAVFFLFDFLRINDLFHFFNRNKVVILCYHGVSEDDFDLLRGYDERHVPRSLFRRQLQYLKDKGFRFVSLTELVGKINRKEEIGRHVVLTFDDGFKNVIDNAYPMMREIGAKGCIYPVSGIAGKGDLLWTDLVEAVIRHSPDGDFTFKFEGRDVVYRLDSMSSRHQAMIDIKAKIRSVPDRKAKEYLRQFEALPVGTVPKEFRLADWQELGKLDPSILEVGSHTRSHPNCTTLSSPEELQEELQHSKADIEQKIGYEVKHFCYPGGAFNGKTIDYLKRYGYGSAVSANTGFVDGDADIYKLKRIFAGEDLLLFKATVSGSYFAISRLWLTMRGKVPMETSLAAAAMRLF